MFLIDSFVSIKFKYIKATNEKMYLNSSLLTATKLCKNPCSLYSKFVASKIKVLKFVSLVDIVPSIIKCRIYYKIFKNYRMIKRSNYENLSYQIMEFNYILYSNYILFKKIYIQSFKLFFNSLHYNNNTVGIHYRMNDICFTKTCKVKQRVINRIKYEINKKFRNNITLFISTVNSNTSKLLANELNYYEFMPKYKAVHVSKLNRSLYESDRIKIIGDILFVSSAKYLILTKGSTFSYLILSINGVDSLGKRKEYITIDEVGNIERNGNIDIIEYEMSKHKCIPALFYSII